MSNSTQKEILRPILATGGIDEKSDLDKKSGKGEFNFFHRFLDGWINSAMAISALSVVCILLVVCNMFLLLMLETKFSQEKVALVPSGLEKTISVRTGEVSPEYLRQMGLIIASLYVSFSPKTIKNNIETILDYGTPEFYAKNSKRLRRQSLLASQSELSQTFVIRDIRHKGRNVFVRGSIRRYSYGKMVDLKDNAVVVVRIGYNPSLHKTAIESLGLYNDYNKWVLESMQKIKKGS